MSKQDTDTMRIYSTEFKGVMINIFGTICVPLFKVYEIKEILKIDGIEELIKDFDETLKVTRNDEEMLTEHGIYEILFMLNDDVGKEFRKLITRILREMRIKEIQKCKHVINTLKTMDQNIGSETLNERLRDSGVESQIKSKGVAHSRFEKWLEDNLEAKEGAILSLKDICSKCDLICENGPNGIVAPRIAGKYKNEVTTFLKKKVLDVDPGYKDFSFDGKRYGGWIGIQLKS